MPPYADNRRGSSSGSVTSIAASPTAASGASIFGVLAKRNSISTTPVAVVTKSPTRKNKIKNATNIDSSIQREANKALHELENSFYAVFNFLEQNGVSRASVEELRKETMESNEDAEVYIIAMERAQQYGECLYSISLSPSSSSPCSSRTLIHADLMVHCFVSAWESVHRYTTVLHRSAHKIFHERRRANQNNQFRYNIDDSKKNQYHYKSNADDDDIARLFEKSAEECSRTLKGLILVRSWGAQWLERMPPIRTLRSFG